MSTNNQIPATSQDEHPIQPRACDISFAVQSTEYASEALKFFERCFNHIRHYVAIDLCRLRRLYPCTIAHVDLRFHILYWLRNSYLEDNGMGYVDSLNELLELLGLPQIDWDVYYDLDYSAACNMFDNFLNNAVDYIQSGICENWRYLCEQSGNESAVCQHREHNAPQEYFAFSKKYTMPKQHAPLARKLLYDCFCYMYGDITCMPKGSLNNEVMEHMVHYWLIRTYCDHKDSRCVLKTLLLLGEIFEVEVPFLSKGLIADFWKDEKKMCGLQLTYHSMNIARHMGNCLIDLWDEFVEEYFNEDFQTMSLIDFAPGKE